MSNRREAAVRTIDPRSKRTWASLLSVAAMACSALVVPSAGQVFASAGDTAVSSSRFLGGSLLLDGFDLDSIAVLDGTNSSNSGSPTPDTDTATLDLTALQTANVVIPGGITLGVLPSVLQVGAVNHYSQASDEGISRAASGAVSNAGIVDTTGSGSFPSDAQISLTPLLTGPAFAGVIDQLNISAGAITGVAALDARQGSPATTCTDLSAPAHCRDYNVADLTAELESPAVAGIVDLLTGPTGVAATVDAELAALVGADGPLAQALASVTGVPGLVGNAGVDISITSDVTTAIDAVIDAGLTDGVIDIDLRTGEVVVDLDALLQAVTGTGVNDLDPNTEIISVEVLTALADRIDALLATLPALVESAVTTSLYEATLQVAVIVCLGLLCSTSVVIAVDGTIAEVLAGTATASIALAIDGLPVTISVSALLTALAAPLDTALFDGVTGVVSSSKATLTAEIIVQGALLVDSAIDALSSIVSLVANVQEAGSTPGSFREVALRLTIGDLVGAGGVGTIDLGRAEVGRNTVVPTGISMSPVRGPVAGGTLVTITGTDFVDGETSVLIGGNTVDAGDVTVVSSTSLTFDTPAHAQGVVGVTVTSPGGTTSPALTYTYDPVPTESSMTPVRGPVAGGTTVTITGTGFVAGATSVLIGGNTVDAGDVTVAPSLTSLTFDTPAHVLGEVDVTVATPGGTSSPALKYTYDPIPTETDLTPVRGPLAGGTEVTIDGSGFVIGETTVTIGAISVPAVVTSETSLTFVTPAHVASTVPVSVTTPGGSSAATLTFTYDPIPTQTSLTPDSGPAAGGTSVDVVGTGFIVGETTVNVGDVSVAATVNSSTSLTFVIPAHDAGAANVTVTTTGGTSDPLTYTYDPIPVGTSLTPNRGPVVGGTTVTVTGTGFVDGETSVSIGGNTVDATDVTVASSLTSLTFDTPAHAAGAVGVTVMTPGGTSSPALSYAYDPIPTESSMTPVRGPVAGGTEVTVEGSGFVAGATSVLIGGNTVDASDVTVNSSSTSLTFDTPAHAAGVVGVTVTTPGGTSSPALSYTYDPIPTESSMTPVRGPVAGGTEVTVEGTGFLAGATSVLIGGNTVDASDVTVNSSSTSLTFDTPAHAAGEVKVTATTTGGTSAPLTYTYDPIPVGLSLTPNHGPITGGTIVTINGSGFVAGATTVTIDTTSMAATVTNPSTLTFITPSHALGQVNVTVTTPGGTSAPLVYIYDLAPNTSSLAPERGPVVGGTTVTVAGSGFEAGATEVTIDGTTIPAAEVSVDGTTSLTFVTPMRPVASVEVTVTTPGGTSDPALTYNYDPIPTETSLTPERGPISGGTTVTITGTGFIDDWTTVQIGGNDVTPTAVSSDSLTFVTPAHAAGEVDVTVTTPGGTSSPALSYTYDPVPTESSMTPVRGSVAGGTTVTITGTGFVDGATSVKIDTTTITPADVGVISGTSLTFVTPAHSLGAVGVAVTTPGGTSNPLTYTYQAVPTISQLSPPRGPLDGGLTITATGTGFIPGDTTIIMNGTRVAASATSETSLTFVNPPAGVSAVPISADTSGGTSAPVMWNYDPIPTASPLTPSRAIAAGGAIVTIDGTGFITGFTSVSVDGLGVPVEVASETLATFVAPPHAAGVIDVVLTTTGGATAPRGFTYLPIPEMTGLDVVSGPASGGTTVTIGGSGFLISESLVEIGDEVIGADDVEVTASGTSLTFVTPAHRPGDALLTVRTPGGRATPPLTFNFAAPSPLAPPGGLPETGSDSMGLLASALLLLMVGGLFVAVANDRRRDVADVVSVRRSRTFES